ncbi:MAG: anti-sigma factor family protein [Bryobacteraceae bacterium]
MPNQNIVHASEETLESYSLGRLPEPEIEAFEEHLLVCHSCQDRLEEVESFIHATKAAAVQLQNEPSSLWQRIWESVLVVPKPVWAAACAALLVMAIVVPGRFTSAPESAQVVELSALREGSSAPRIQAGAPIELKLSTAELPAASSYTVEVVDGSGTVVWESRVDAEAEQLTVSIPERLSAGRHWVRLYSDSLKTDLLREYALQVQE